MKSIFGRTALWMFGTIVLALGMAPFASAQRGGGGKVQLPGGEARKVILNDCTTCHGIDPFGTKRLDRAGWQSLVDSMKAKGADVPDKDVSILLDYLVKSFGPDVPLPGGGRGGQRGGGAGGPDDATLALLNGACTACHNLNRVNTANNTKDSWQDIVDRMKGKGAKITDADVPGLVDFLFRNHGPM